QTLTLVFGLNEAGKSSALRAIGDLRYGIPQQSPDDFIHAYRSMRVGAQLVDANSTVHTLMRRKGRGTTLFAVDHPGNERTPDKAAPAELEALRSGGLTRDEFEIRFGLDHQRLRA